MDFKPEDTLKKLAKDVTDAAQPYIEKVEPYIEKVEPMAQDLFDKAEPVLNMVKEKAAPVTKKATQAAKTVGDGISLRAAKINCKEEIYVQYGQHEVRTTDIVDRAKSDYVSKGNKLSDIKEIQVYLKPAENAVYYVVNHSETGKIEA